MSRTTKLDIPASIKEYCTQPAVATAVNYLVGVKPDKFPPELEWEEASEYFEARKAAEIVRYDMAILLHQMWQLIWQPAIASGGWKKLSIDEHIADDSGYIHAQECFNEDMIFLAL